MAEALPRLVERMTVIHVTGEAGYPAALATRETLPEAVRGRYRPHPFLREEMLAALAAADLVVGRAGSSTLAEATALGLPMIVVPVSARRRPPAGQRRQPGRGRGGAARSTTKRFDAAALVEAAGLLDDPLAHATMSAAARGLGRPGAAAAVAELVLAAAGRRPLPDVASIERLARGPRT